MPLFDIAGTRHDTSISPWRKDRVWVTVRYDDARWKQNLMTLRVQPSFTVLSLINPFVCGMIFDNIETDRSRTERQADAARGPQPRFS